MGADVHRLPDRRRVEILEVAAGLLIVNVEPRAGFEPLSAHFGSYEKAEAHARSIAGPRGWPIYLRTRRDQAPGPEAA